MRSRLAKEPQFDQTVFDTGLLCQSEIGFQAELDVASIWERVRVFTLTGCRRGLPGGEKEHEQHLVAGVLGTIFRGGSYCLITKASISQGKRLLW
ncbi:MAG: hypothetical protein V3T52_06500 [Thermodesulfobacteriota bacterium]